MSLIPWFPMCLLLLSPVQSPSANPVTNRLLLRPINDMPFILHNVTISFKIRRSLDLRYSVEHLLFAEAVDSSIYQFPVRSPNFLGRSTVVQRLAKDSKQREVWMTQAVKKRILENKLIVDYGNEFFPKPSPITIDLKGTKTLDQRGSYGLQERFYWDKVSQNEEMYLFTNFYPNHVSEALPMVNDWRTNITLKLRLSNFQNYSVTTAGLQESLSGSSYSFVNTSLSGVSFVVARSMNQSNVSSNVTFSFQDRHKRDNYKPLMHFRDTFQRLLERYSTFLSMKLPIERIHVVTLPSLSVRPLILASKMCILDQDWILSQVPSYEFLVGQCFLHQYFSSSLLPYSDSVRFVSESLFHYYTILSLQSESEREIRLWSIINQVMEDEGVEGTTRRLFSDYERPMVVDERSTRKGIYIMHMFRSHFEDKAEFDSAIRKFIEKGPISSYSLMDFLSVFSGKQQQLKLASNNHIWIVFKGWTSGAGYTVITVDHEHDNSLNITARNVFGRIARVTPLILQYNLGSESSVKSQVIWRNFTMPATIPLSRGSLYVVNGERNTPARVMYPVEYWEKLLLAKAQLSVKTRGVLLSDSYYFERKGLLGFHTIFQYLKWLNGESDALLWISAESILVDMNRRFLFTDLHTILKATVRSYIPKFYGARHEHNLSLPIRLACWSGLPVCLRETEAELWNFVSRAKSVSPVNLDTVLCGGMRRVAEERFDYLIEINTKMHQERDILLMAMCCTETDANVELFLRTIFLRNDFKLGLGTDMKYLLLLNTFLSSATGAKVVWRFITQRHEILFELFGRRRFQELCLFLADGHLKSMAHIQAVKTLFQKYDMPERTVLAKLMENYRKARQDVEKNYLFMVRSLAL